MHEINDLKELIRSRVPIILIESQEENRVLTILEKLAPTIRQSLYGWSIIDGFAQVMNAQIKSDSKLEPTELLYHIFNMKMKGVFVLLDFHPYLTDDRNARLLKQIAKESEKYQQTIILLSHHINVPDEIKHLTAHFELPLPDEQSLKNMIMEVGKKWITDNPGSRITTEKHMVDVLIQNLKGLTLPEARKLVWKALADGSLTKEDIPVIAEAKYKLLNKDGVLYYEQDTSSFQHVGGLKTLKQWLEQRKAIFLGQVERHGLDLPKGVLLLGVQGSGKSLAAKAIAGTWGVALLRLDFGTLYNKYYGETERQTRDALKMAEMMAPCVLWIDEIEKGVATDNSDGGTSKRVLGTLLTWMAERDSATFVVATANDIQCLPPELMRKGRLDEIFFVDLPDENIRKEIFRIHLDKRDLNSALFNFDELAEVSNGFSGAEIEQAIVSGLYSMIGESGKLTQAALVDEIRKTRPLSVIMAEQIDDMRRWAMDRTVSAN
ncbi:AAA family ATPase [candidate division KSB1 bacterium]|nr:AAA family ATPase [candidate division KSB1 bacterium]